MIWFIIGAVIIFIIAIIVAVSFFRVCAVRNVKGLAGRLIGTAMGETGATPALIKEGYEFSEGARKEYHELKSYDGLTLRAVYYPCKNAVRSIICVHGYRGTGISNFAGALKFFHEIGSNVLMIDQRGCGKSDGRYICFGMKERYDVVSWAKWLNAEKGDGLPVYLDGISLGGTTVLMASCMDLPDNIVGIIDDCGYTTPKEIIKYMARRYMHIPEFPIVQLVNIINKLVSGQWLGSVDCRDCVKEAKVPIFFGHGLKDRLVPPKMGDQNYNACGTYKVQFISENAGHGGAFVEDNEAYIVLIKKFFLKCERDFDAKMHLV